MKKRSIRFSQLRRLLLGLQFTEARKEKGWRFDHPESETTLVYWPYRLDEKVSLMDIDTTRRHLDWRGLLSAEAFEHSLAKTPA